MGSHQRPPPRPPPAPRPLALPSSQSPSAVSAEEKTDGDWVSEFRDILLSLPQTLSTLYLILLKSDDSAHYSLPLHCIHLALSHPQHAQFLLDHTARCIPLINRAIGEALSTLALFLSSADPAAPDLTPKPAHLLHVRPFHLPSPLLRRLSDVRSRDVGSLVCVTGSVVRCQDRRVYEFARQLQCESCSGLFLVYADDDNEHRIELPDRCQAAAQPEANEGNSGWRRGAGRQVCRSERMRPTALSLPRDVQSIRVQEQLHRSHLALPRSLLVRLTDDMCEAAKTGDVVQVTGMVRRQWRPLAVGQRVEIEPYIDAHHLHVVASSASSAASLAPSAALPSPAVFAAYWSRADGRGLRARDHIVRCLAPGLMGLFLPKLACLLALIGGVKKEDSGARVQEVEEKTADAAGRETERGLSIRGDIHILLVGDAGVGKSVLLQACSLLSQRGVLTTGTGTTTAGLTVAATRNSASRGPASSASSSSSSAFSLEPGALVLADLGVCCIDEFNCISRQDRLAMHEAMEQQTLSVAKGGLLATLSTRTSIIAALNPKGRYEHDVDLSVNTSLSSPLLSRFDLILVLLDTRNDERDEKVAQHLLHALPSAAGQGVKKQEEEPEDEAAEDGADGEAIMQSLQQLTQQQLTQRAGTTTASQLLSSPWSSSTLQAYISYVKSRYFPVLSPACQALLTRYYQLQRRSDGGKQARITIRQLESLVRLTQAHARLMCRHQCLLLDAVMAVVVMEHSVLSCGLLAQRRSAMIWSSAIPPTTVSALHLDFSAQPEADYDAWQQTILDRLDMQHLAAEADRGSSGSASAAMAEEEKAEAAPERRRRRDNSQPAVHAVVAAPSSASTAQLSQRSDNRAAVAFPLPQPSTATASRLPLPTRPSQPAAPSSSLTQPPPATPLPRAAAMASATPAASPVVSAAMSGSSSSFASTAPMSQSATGRERADVLPSHPGGPAALPNCAAPPLSIRKPAASTAPSSQPLLFSQPASRQPSVTFALPVVGAVSPTAPSASAAFPAQPRQQMSPPPPLPAAHDPFFLPSQPSTQAQRPPSVDFSLLPQPSQAMQRQQLSTGSSSSSSAPRAPDIPLASLRSTPPGLPAPRLPASLSSPTVSTSPSAALSTRQFSASPLPAASAAAAERTVPQLWGSQAASSAASPALSRQQVVATPPRSRPPVPASDFLTPVKPPAPPVSPAASAPPLSVPSTSAASLASPLSNLSNLSSLRTPVNHSSLSSPLSALSSSSAASQVAGVNAVPLPSSFAVAVKFTNPFLPSSETQRPAVGVLPARPPLAPAAAAVNGGSGWLTGISDDVLNDAELGL